MSFFLRGRWPPSAGLASGRGDPGSAPLTLCLHIHSPPSWGSTWLSVRRFVLLREGGELSTVSRGERQP